MNYRLVRDKYYVDVPGRGRIFAWKLVGDSGHSPFIIERAYSESEITHLVMEKFRGLPIHLLIAGSE